MSSIYKLIGHRLNEARKDKDKTLEEVGNRIGVHKSTIQRWENGKTEKISTSAIEVLADFYGVNSSWLAGKNVPKYSISNKVDELGNAVVDIPLLGTVKAGYDYMAQENWERTIDLDKKVADTGEFFALKVKGDSMIPAFFEGDIVIIRKQNDCENNQVAVVIVNGDEGTLKKVKKTDEGIILQPFNPAYGPVMYTNKEIKETPIIIAGVFQELRRTELKF
ncbi:MAG: helix-turn-helix domain-containing protein [Clostridia bacterium]|nr:helix-turn-helix domain-containing protein [Clostridia bacterium]